MYCFLARFTWYFSLVMIAERLVLAVRLISTVLVLTKEIDFRKIRGVGRQGGRASEKGERRGRWLDY